MAVHTKDYRYFIVNLLRDLAVGDTFTPQELHISILPWFALETDETSFIRWFYRHFDQLAAFEATVGELKMFGPKKDVPVHIVEPHGKFQVLHELALSWFGALGARWAERDPYVGDDFIPHVAERHGLKLETGQKLLIDSVVLVKAKRHEDHIRTIAAKAELHA